MPIDTVTRRCAWQDKANAMRHGHDLWQRVYKMVAAEKYPNIESKHLYVDVLTMEMVRCPEQFEVVVTNNLFGDIVTDLGAILQGGIGLAGSGNINPGTVSTLWSRYTVLHQISLVKKSTTPLATILSLGMMYTHLGRPDLEGKISLVSPPLFGVQSCDPRTRWHFEDFTSNRSSVETDQSNSVTAQVFCIL